MSERTIELDKYARGVSVLAGRERGGEVRKLEKLDELDSATETAKIVVVIPDYVVSVNSSFFLGMFEESLRILGERVFRENYSFVGPNADDTKNDGIRTALLMGRRFRPRRPADRVA